MQILDLFKNGYIGSPNASTKIAYSIPESAAIQPIELNMQLDAPHVETPVFDIPESTANQVETTSQPAIESPETIVESGEKITVPIGIPSREELPVRREFTPVSEDWETRVKYITNWLKENTNFNNIQISGILACLTNESGLNANAKNKQEAIKWNNDYRVGRGLAQWSLSRGRDYSDWHNRTFNSTGDHFADQDDIDTQLQFMLYEMQFRPAFMAHFANAKTPEEAADIFRRGYENGSANALATREQMNRYVNVGSLDADGFYNKDSIQAKKIYNIINNYNG